MTILNSFPGHESSPSGGSVDGTTAAVYSKYAMHYLRIRHIIYMSAGVTPDYLLQRQGRWASGGYKEYVGDHS